jgi:hypothetical protein
MEKCREKNVGNVGIPSLCMCTVEYLNNFLLRFFIDGGEANNNVSLQHFVNGKLGQF